MWLLMNTLFKKIELKLNFFSVKIIRNLTMSIVLRLLNFGLLENQYNKIISESYYKLLKIKTLWHIMKLIQQFYLEY